jgi:ATP-dependent RNA helicase DHX37/DHR1
VEDINLGDEHQDNLAFDVDGNMDDEDPEALESDEDERVLEEELGVDTDGKFSS